MRSQSGSHTRHKPNFQQLNADYSNAMRELSRKYPDDLDAATLSADSMMNLRPWKLWNADGTPAAERRRLWRRLKSVLRRDPNHIGAMHLHIHAVEASPNPERALTDADRIATLAPAAGHLVHMPAHVYERTGNYDGAREQNAAAAKADEDYAAATGSQGMYMMMYYSHNLHFGAISASMQGHCAGSKSSQRNGWPTICAPWRRRCRWSSRFSAFRWRLRLAAGDGTNCWQ